MGRKWNLTGWLRTERTWWVPFKPAMSVWYGTWHPSAQKTAFHAPSSFSTMNKLWWNKNRPFILCPVQHFLHWFVAGSQDAGSSFHLDQIVPGPESPVTWWLTTRQGSLSVILKCHVASDGWHSHARLVSHSHGHPRLAQGYRQSWLMAEPTLFLHYREAYWNARSDGAFQQEYTESVICSNW